MLRAEKRMLKLRSC